VPERRSALEVNYTGDYLDENGRLAVDSSSLEHDQGRVPDHVVNPAALDRPGFRAKLARFAANASAPI